MADDDDSYVSTATFYAQEDVVSDWLKQSAERAGRKRVTELVLFPAALYGHLNILTLALPFGDIHANNSKGLSLLDAAIEGVQRSFVESSQGDHGNRPMFLTAVPEMRAQQLDIILALLRAGIRPDKVNSSGQTAAARAVGQENPFREAAILLDLFTKQYSPKHEIMLPGVDAEQAAYKSTKLLVEWAYMKGHVDILKLLQASGVVDLCSDTLILSHTDTPLFLHALRGNSLETLQVILESKNPNDALNHMYEYNVGTIKVRESGISVLCKMHAQDEQTFSGRYMDPVPSPLSQALWTLNVTQVVLTHLGLKGVPPAIFGDQLKHLELQGNDLVTLPLAPRGLGEGRPLPCPSLTFLNVSSNGLTTLPSTLFCLPNLTILYATNNKIHDLPLDLWLAPKLETLSLSKNVIRGLPCPPSIPLDVACHCPPGGVGGDGGGGGSGGEEPVAKGYAPQQASLVRSLRQVHVSNEFDSSEDLSRFQLGCILETLDLTDNQLSEVPCGLSCLVPILKTLKLAGNKIRSLGDVRNYPATLVTLDVSKNALTSAFSLSRPRYACYQAKLRNTTLHCSHGNHTKLGNLRILSLFENKLESVSILNENVNPPEIIFPRLSSLKLSKNQLKQVPYDIHKLVSLSELAVDLNPAIEQLPLRIHLLEQLFSFKFEGIRDPIVHELSNLRTASEMRYYLRARETNACQNFSMRLFVLGHYHKGKTTLLHRLRGLRSDSAKRGAPGVLESEVGTCEALKSIWPSNNGDVGGSTVGIECGMWLCRKPSHKMAPKITFYTWDFAGQEEYYLTHQCFLTNRALNLVVWNATEEERGLEGLNIWLQNLHAKASRATVIIVGTHWDMVPRDQRAEKEKKWKELITSMYASKRQKNRDYPKIEGVFFVGSKNIGVEDLTEGIYNIATDMDSPDVKSSSFKVKILEEKIPKSYDDLRQKIAEVVTVNDVVVEDRDKFSKSVSHIISSKELDTAVDYLYSTMGVILHFNQPILKDYYILNPQRWFDYCAIVVSPENVSKVVPRGADPQSGLLSIDRLEKEYAAQGIAPGTARLICHFLHAFHIIHPIGKDTFLAPSAIALNLNYILDSEMGTYPRCLPGQPPLPTEAELEARPVNTLFWGRAPVQTFKIQATGLVYRRLFLMPPLASGFWNELISLCLQRNEFFSMIQSDVPGQSYCEDATFFHRAMIGNVSVFWQYWKTGMVLYLDQQVMLRMNSIQGYEYEGTQPPQLQSQSRLQQKLRTRSLQYVVEKEWIEVPPEYSEVMEVVVPEVVVGEGGANRPSPSLKLLGKALEMFDEVLQNHCHSMAEQGIYSVGEMLHLVPCPLCVGDRDARKDAPPPSLKNHPLCAFSLEYCIRRSLEDDCVECPWHKRLELELIAPDLLFADFGSMKLDKKSFSEPIQKTEAASAGCQGSFGKVLRRVIRDPLTQISQDVAVKIFERFDDVGDVTTELTKNYAAMRYELNKLHQLDHPYVVKLVGVITNPHSFVLEWATLFSFELLRKQYGEKKVNMCPTSVALAMLQVTDALEYLHEKQRLVHNDLRCSNILVFRFPDPGHACYDGKPQGFRCKDSIPNSSEGLPAGILVKLGDLGICVNPTAQRAKKDALRRVTPESVEYEGNLTDKVDIFMLGTCLYEILSLRGLPPSNLSEMEYKNFILSGQRPQFHCKDPAYPLVMYQVLQECWQHELYNRPTAASLKAGIEAHTGLAPDGHCRLTSSCPLLDTLVLPPCHKVAASCVWQDKDSFKMGVALADGTDATSNSRIVVISHSGGGGGGGGGVDQKLLLYPETVLLLEGQAKVMCFAGSDDIIIGCTTGHTYSISLSRQNSTPLFPDHTHHGPVVSLSYVEEERVLVVGYEESTVLVSKHVVGLGTMCGSRVYCESLLQKSCTLHTLLCLRHDQESLEVWCGCSNGSLEVWSVRTASLGTHGRLQKDCSVLAIRSPFNVGVPVRVREMRVRWSRECPWVVALLEQDAVVSVVCFDARSNAVLKHWECPFQVDAFDVVSSKGVFAGCDGRIRVMDLEATQSSAALLSTTAIGHYSSVCAVHHLYGSTKENGVTSFFHTFLGRPVASTCQDFVLSVGVGNLMADLNNAFPNSVLKEDLCINAWMI
eukprot:Em0016g389a